MDRVFLANIPDISRWGTLKTTTSIQPRQHTYHTLMVTVNSSAASYRNVVNEMAVLIAAARLSQEYLSLWSNAVARRVTLTEEDRKLIGRALARGTCRSRSDWQHSIPPCNDDHFKGHLVEVLLFCIRIYLDRNGTSDIRIFQPPIPKMNSATGGIDLLEVGQISSDYYFHVWECKGTDTDLVAAFGEAAAQLCASDGTAHQGFMEAHRCILARNLRDRPLVQFIRDMPRKFYCTPAHNSKRLGGAVGTGLSFNTKNIEDFSRKIGVSATNTHANCQAIIVRIIDFPQFRKDVYQYLWNIY